MKILFVHIGTPKTGTTAIQKFCMDNRKQLRKYGFCYPVFPYYYYGKSRNRNGVFLTQKMKIQKNSHRMEEAQRIFTEGLDIIKNKFGKYDNVIVSDEGMWNIIEREDGYLLREMYETAKHDGYMIKLIVYLRRQDEYGASIWNQRIKKKVDVNKATYSWEDFINSPENKLNFDYYRTLEYAANILGKDNIIVRRYDRNHLKGGLSQVDFLDALGLEWTDEYVLNKTELNEKLSLNCCEIKRIVNDIPEIKASELRQFQYALGSITKTSEEEYPCSIWSADDAQNFMRHYDENNQKIVETFIRDGQPLFSHDFVERDVWRQNNPHMQNDIIRFAASSDVLIIRQQQELNRKITELNEQIAELQKHVNMLRSFRLKIRHPFKSLFHILDGRF